jgi:hypothetical protein
MYTLARKRNQAILPTILVVKSSTGLITTMIVITVAITANVILAVLFLSRDHGDLGTQVIHAGNKMNSMNDIPTRNIFI